MEHKGIHLCDFCFTPIIPGNICQSCGLTHDSYKAEGGLLKPGVNLLGKYIIGRALGRGGFGATYLAYSTLYDKVVAVKEYFPAGIAYRGTNNTKVEIVSEDKRTAFEKGAEKLFDEAKTMSKFNMDKNIVSVYEFFNANDTVYYSMEYLEGIDLKGYITRRGGRISEGEAITIMKNVCEALKEIHSTMTMHRDISPDNIFVCTNGEVKLIDFGAAKQVVGEYSQKNYSVVVKHGFAPAEQYKTNGKQGAWTDIYALGATIYYALTGKVPDDATSRMENPELSFDGGANISPGFAEIISKCLENKVSDRYQNAKEVLSAMYDLNLQGTAVGGSEFVQKIYNGVASAKSSDPDVEFASPAVPTNPVSQQPPKSETIPQQIPSSYHPSQYGYSHNSQYNYSQYGQSQYYQQGGDTSNILKGIIIGACALIVVILIVVLIVVLIGNPQPPGGGMMPPPPGGMAPPPGGMMQ